MLMSKRVRCSLPDQRVEAEGADATAGERKQSASLTIALAANAPPELPASVGSYALSPAARKGVASLAFLALLEGHSEWGGLSCTEEIIAWRAPSTLSEQEETKLLTLLRGHPIAHWWVTADIVVILLDTGMRVGELLSLLVKDINFETNLIHIWVNKGDRPRSVPMTSRVREIMAKQCADRIGRVFPVKQDLLSRAWDSARETMGITDDHQFIPHACRHTCASRLVQAGVDLYTVQRFLGHSTIRVTERYAHLSPLMLQTAAQALEKQKIGVIFGDAERNSSPRR